ncbi:hypothetical protein K440DRAFT_531942 [Wilcoxina mikolae CBS 423.85]|nr:hypothetical protein K440DRAFT_531942 [Wilcoxina mikolae CBS 423.85]
MSFKFNFIAHSDDDHADDGSQLRKQHATFRTTTASLVPPKEHTVTSLLVTLPHNISYAFAPTTPQLPRRELYDVRMQLMTEDNNPVASACNDPFTIADLVDVDIRAHVYEGGLKCWECSHDLVAYFSQEHKHSMDLAGNRVLELGCGTALPTLFLFRQMLVGGQTGEFVLADYNVDVLRLVTLPNIFLTWAVATHRLPRNMIGGSGEFAASQRLREEFLIDLESRGIVLRFISGAWGKKMVQLLGKAMFDMVIGSETIYSPTSMQDFTEVLLLSLKSNGRGLVAAKWVYFGVGGSVEEFVKTIQHHKDWGTKMVRDLVEVGVGRVILEVSKKT